MTIFENMSGLQGLAGRYNNPVPESIISPIQGLLIWLLIAEQQRWGNQRAYLYIQQAIIPVGIHIKLNHKIH
jgi:hypothetical protein